MTENSAEPKLLKIFRFQLPQIKMWGFKSFSLQVSNCWSDQTIRFFFFHHVSWRICTNVFLICCLTCWWRKMFWISGFTVCFCGLYFRLSRHVNRFEESLLYFKLFQRTCRRTGLNSPSKRRSFTNRNKPKTRVLGVQMWASWFHAAPLVFQAGSPCALGSQDELRSRTLQQTSALFHVSGCESEPWDLGGSSSKCCS